MRLERLEIEFQGPVARVWLNRPDVHNAFDPEMVDALTATLKKLGAAPDVRAVVLAGAGKNFSSGADIDRNRVGLRGAQAERQPPTRTQR